MDAYYRYWGKAERGERKDRPFSVNFWAKTTKEDKPGISVYHHMLNVGCVAKCLAENRQMVLNRLRVNISDLSALVALHDIGKICPGFQNKCKAWLSENDFLEISQNWNWDGEMESDHALVSQAFLQLFLSRLGLPTKISKYLAASIGAHHGTIRKQPDDRGVSTKKISEGQTGIDWDLERNIQADAIWNYFMGTPGFESCGKDSPALWWLAGLTSIADWIGSNERFFVPDTETTNPEVVAFSAVQGIGLIPAKIRKNLTFHELFYDEKNSGIQWSPNDMQQKAWHTIQSPGVYVIEAPMGMGKTEAALWAAYGLLSDGQATGIYFALPTQATSNRMYRRIDSFLKRILTSPEQCQLIHANSWLMDNEYVIQPAKTGLSDISYNVGKDWFSSPKRSIIAHFGVGTIDQALLGVVAAKHFFVRHFALSGKVVILDEIHSYDIYTKTLIDKLVETLEHLGCTVIILSATLCKKQLSMLVGDKVFGNIMDGELPYPTISGRNEFCNITPLSIQQPLSKTVSVDFVGHGFAENEAMQLAEQGGAVLWICNTVDQAQSQYQSFSEKVQKKFPIGLLHSRYPYWRREELEDEWMTRFGKDGKTRCGSILISTQICEQSVDLDADLLVTELAPTDMILQRLGRLWRHDRSKRPIKFPQLYILKESESYEELTKKSAKEVKDVFGGKARVYSPYVLLRTLRVWSGIKQVVVPDQIRRLIESTYSDDVNDEFPEVWWQLYEEWYGSDSAKTLMAKQVSNVWGLPMLDDEEGAQTRLNEVPTIPIVLCQSIEGNKVVFLDGMLCQLKKNKKELPIAQAIHKNLVKVPEYWFDSKKWIFCPLFEEYLGKRQTVGIVSGELDSTDMEKVLIKNIQNGKVLMYSRYIGLKLRHNLE